MAYRFMRLLVFFDLPVVTKKQRKVYSDFRRYLIKNGYMMIQYSIYAKIFNNRDALNNHVNTLNKNVPQEGHLRLMMVTEKQYANMVIIIGGKSNQEKVLTIDPFILL